MKTSPVLEQLFCPIARWTNRRRIARPWIPAILLCILCGAPALSAQQFSRAALLARPQPLDTTRLLGDQPVKSPWGALFRSAVLPGWGQVYNEKYWKAAGVVALHAILIQRAIHFHRAYRETGNPELRRIRSNYYWLLGIAYVLNFLDAFVDAYLYGIDLVVAAQEPGPEGKDMVGLRVSIVLPGAGSHPPATHP